MADNLLDIIEKSSQESGRTFDIEGDSGGPTGGDFLDTILRSSGGKIERLQLDIPEEVDTQEVIIPQGPIRKETPSVWQWLFSTVKTTFNLTTEQAPLFFAKGQQQVSIGLLRSEQMDATPERAEEIESRIANIIADFPVDDQEFGTLLDSQSLVERSLLGATQLIPQFIAGAQAFVPGAAAGAATGGAASLLAPQLAPLLITGGAGVLGTLNTFEHVRRIEGGLLFHELLKLRDPEGRPMDRQIAKQFAQVYSYFSAAVEVAQFGQVARAVGGKEALMKLLKLSPEDLVKNPSVREVLFKVGIEAVQLTALETTEEVIQEAGAFIAEEQAKKLSNSVKGTAFEGRTWDDFVEVTKETAVQSFLAFAPFSLIGLAPRSISQVRTMRNLQSFNSAIEKMEAIAEKVPFDFAEDGTLAPKEGISLNRDMLGTLFKENFQLTRRETEAVLRIVDARARSLNMPTDEYVAGRFADVKVGRAGLGEFFLEQTAPWVSKFISNVSIAVDGIKQERFNKGQLQAAIAKTKGGQEHAKWIKGFSEFVDSQDTFSKEDVLNFIAKNPVTLNKVINSHTEGGLQARANLREVTTSISDIVISSRQGEKPIFQQDFSDIVSTVTESLTELGVPLTEIEVITRDLSVESSEVLLNQARFKIEDLIINLRVPQFEDTQVVKGGENYREHIFSLPDEMIQVPFEAHVFSDLPNTIGWARTTDFQAPDGSKVLMVQEIQKEQINEDNITALPAPFFGTDRVYEHILKDLIRTAAEEGYDSIAFTTGKDQAQLSGQQFIENVEEIKFQKVGPGLLLQEGKDTATSIDLIHLEVKDNTGRIQFSRDLSPDELTRIVGAKVADDMLKGTEESGVITGEDLTVGGAFFRQLYDEKIPRILKKLTGEDMIQQQLFRDIPAGPDVVAPFFRATQPSIALTPKLKEKALYKGFSLFQATDHDFKTLATQANLDAEAMRSPRGTVSTGRAFDENNTLNNVRDRLKIDTRLKGLREAARMLKSTFGRVPDSVLQMIELNKQGFQGLFQKAKGAITFLEDGRAVIHALENADVSTAIHELAHVFFNDLDEQQRKVITKWAGVENALIDKFNFTPSELTQQEWIEVRSALEQFARAFELWLRTGKAPTSSLRSVFELFKRWLKRIYHTVKGSELEFVQGPDGKPKRIKISDEVNRVFKELLTTPEERLSGVVRTVNGLEYQVKGHNGVPVITTQVKGKATLVDVTNLVEGRKPNPLQNEVLGPRATWISEFEELEQTTFEDFENQLEYDERELRSMDRTELNKVAKSIGIQKPEKIAGDDLKAQVEQTSRNKIMLTNPEIPLLGFERDGLRRSTSNWAKSIALLPKKLWDMNDSFRWMDLIDHVEQDGGGGNIQQQTAEKGRRVVDDYKRIMGVFDATLQKLLLLSGGLTPTSKTVRAANSLNTVTWDGNAGFSRFTIAREKKLLDDTALDLTDKPLTDAELRILDAFKALFDLVGKTAADRKLMIRVKDPETGEVSSVRFDPRKSEAGMNRVASEDFWTIMTMDDPFMREELARVLARLNDMEESVALTKLEGLKKNIARSTSLEFMRAFPIVPDRIRIRTVTGFREIQLLETHPFSLGTRMAHSMAKRLSFIKEFSQDRKTNEAYINNYIRAGGSRRNIEELFRAFNGVPISDNRLSDISQIPGGIGGQMLEAYKGLQNVYTAMILTRSQLINVFETAGNVQSLVGANIYYKTLFKMLTAVLSKPFNPALTEQLHNVVAQAGARSLNVASNIVDPSRRWRDVTSIIGDRLLRVTGVNFANRTNEFIAGLSAADLAKKFLNNKGGAMDRFTLQVLKFSESEIDAFMSGKATEELNKALINRFVTHTQSTNAHPAERSRAANNPDYRLLIRFDTYEMRNSPLTMRELSLWYDTIKDPNRSKREKFAASRHVFRFMNNSVVSGALNLGLLSLALYGKSSILMADWDDDGDGSADDILLFLAQAFAYKTFAGPASAWTFLFQRGERNLAAIALNATIPVNMIGEMSYMAFGFGRYSNMTGIQRTLEFFRKNTTVTGPIATWASIFGLGGKNVELSLARRKYWLWRKENQTTRTGRTEISGESAEDKDFHRHMKNAFRIMHKDPSYLVDGITLKESTRDELFAALRIQRRPTLKENVDSARRAILGRRLLPKIKKELRTKFVKDINPLVLEELQAHDDLLQAWSDYLKELR